MNKNITSIWNNNFSFLTKKKKNELCFIIEPFLVCIELVNLPRIKEYRPYVVFYPLYSGKFLSNKAMNIPVFMEEVYKKNGNQYSIKIDDEEQTIEAIQSLKSQFPFFTGDNVLFEDFFNFFRSLANTSKIIAQIKQPDVYEFLYLAALNLSAEKSDIVLTDIKENSKNWNIERFEIYYGKIENWINKLESLNHEDLKENILKTDKYHSVQLI
jgi:hypothetical protein